MPQLATNQASSIYIQGNHLKVRDDNGKEKTYKIIIRNKQGVIVPLAEADQNKLLSIIKKILQEANLDKPGVDLHLAHLKGNVLSYKGQNTTINKNTYEKLQKTIKKVQATALKTNDASKKALSDEHSIELQPSHSNRWKQNFSSAKNYVVGQLGKIRNVLPKQLPQGAKDLVEISTLLEAMISSGGKLVLKERALYLAEKDSKHSPISPIAFICKQVRVKLDSDLCTDDDLLLARSILEKIQQNDWCKSVLNNQKGNKPINQLFEDTFEMITDKQRDHGNFSSAKNFYQALYHPVILNHFLLSYRSIFPGVVDHSGEPSQASKSLEMLKFLRDEMQKLPGSYYGTMLNMVKTWLENDDINEQDFANKDVQAFIRELIDKAPASDFNEAVALSTLLQNKDPQSPQIIQPKTKDNAPSWTVLMDRIKKSELKEEYNGFVKQFADDLTTLNILNLQELKLSDMEPHSSSHALSEYNRQFNNVGLIIARQILTPTEGVKPEDSAFRMKAFFNDVLKHLLAEGRMETYMSVLAALNHPDIERLNPKIQEKNLAPRLSPRTHRNELIMRTTFTPISTAFPHLGLMRSDLATLKGRENDQFNRTALKKIADQKRKFLRVKHNLRTDGQLNFHGLHEELRKKQSDSLFNFLSRKITPESPPSFIDQSP